MAPQKLLLSSKNLKNKNIPDVPGQLYYQYMVMFLQCQDTMMIFPLVKFYILFSDIFPNYKDDVDTPVFSGCSRLSIRHPPPGSESKLDSRSLYFRYINLSFMERTVYLLVFYIYIR